MTETIRLALATDEEAKAFGAATSHSGVSLWHKDIIEILDDPLCKMAEKQRPLRTDDAYVVASSTVPRTVRWYARHSDGFRRGFGPVMVVVNDPAIAKATAKEPTP